MTNTTPRPTAWRAGSVLTDDEFKVAMATLKKQAYTPSSSPQKTVFRRVVSGIFQTQKTANNTEEEKACTICLETVRPGEQVAVTPCSHMFHPGCVAPWVKGHGSCPVCRFVLRNGGKVVVDDDGGEDVGAGWGLLEMIRNME